MGMNLPRRLIAIAAIGGIAVVGAAAGIDRQRGDEARTQAEQACEDRGAELQNQKAIQLTAAQRAEALTIAAADPLVQRLWGGSAPPVAGSLGKPGLFLHPKMPITDQGPLGSSTSVQLMLPSALAKGTYRWRTMNPISRNNCSADGFASATIQEADGGAGASGVGQPYSRTPVILIDVSLMKKRVFSMTPNGGEPATWRKVGRPEQLVASSGKLRSTRALR